MSTMTGLLWLTPGRRSNRNVKTDPVWEVCCQSQASSWLSRPLTVEPREGLYSGGFSTAHDLALSSSRLEALKF